MTAQQLRMPPVSKGPRHMEQGGWQPDLPPLRISSPPLHHSAAPLLGPSLCIAIAIAILVLLHGV